MSSTAPDPQKLARIAGWLFVVTFLTSIPALLLYGPVLNHHDYILGAGSDSQLSLGALLEVLLAVANIGTAVALFPILKRRSEGLALGFVASRVLESTVIVIGIVSVMAVVTLRQDAHGDNASLVLVGQSLVAVKDWTFLLGPGFCSAIGNGLVLGYLMYRSELVPRRLAMVGLAGGAMAFLAATGSLLDVWNKGSAPQNLLTVGEFVWELSLGIYLIARGFRPAALATLGVPEAPRATTPPPAAEVVPAVS
jgi:Domain of unknown function (DUF4386)